MLGWSAPTVAPVTNCSTFRQGDGSPETRTRAICAVSPQDDWIRSTCGCARQRTVSGGVVSCTTQSGHTGELHCCLPGCPSATASDGGASTVPAGYLNTLKPWDQVFGGGSSGEDQPGGSQSVVPSSVTPYLVAGGLLLAAVGGVGIWLYSKSKKRQELERTLLRLTAEEDQ